MVKFDLQTVIDWFYNEGDFKKFEEITVRGEVDGILFIGFDTVRVIYPQPRGKGR